MEYILDNIRKEIKKCVDEGKQKFVIAPYGYWGQETKRILNDEYKIIEDFCIDNNVFDMRSIFPINHIPELSKGYVVLVATTNEYYRYQMIESLSSQVGLENIKICVQYSEEQRKVLSSSSKVKLDFLCVGFAKCGTTSLQEALLSHPQIYLPKIKETFFLKNISLESHAGLKESYIDKEMENKLSGGVEPSYFDAAESVYQYFGSNLKLVMFVANPMKALHSLFKMAMRDIGDRELDLIKKYGRVTPELFDEWVNNVIYRYQYIDYIKFYLKYFKADQMEVIISENLYKSPQAVMDKLQMFLEIEDKDRIAYRSFPHANKGGRVAKSYAAACVNKKIWELVCEIKDFDAERQIRKIRHEIFEFTTVPYMDKMLETTYARLYRSYKESISELEHFLGQSLKGIWY